MTQTTTQSPSFNLWDAPWITVERPTGQLETLSLAQTLTEAHRIRALYDPSPLVEVALHRLLVAILQDVFQPENPKDLKRLWQAKQFSAQDLQKFGETYEPRFDLFSEKAPFLQSADLPQQPLKTDNAKSIGYLFLEQPTGFSCTHYTHASLPGQQFCSHCVAKGLVLISAFARAEGAGFKPSLNGVPPLYVLPGGETLFERLCASLLLPLFEPPGFDGEQREEDKPWWKREEALVKKQAKVTYVGYLEGLTFPARRVRLHPLAGDKPCTGCVQRTPWHVSSMIYEMGEIWPEDAPWWRDPFVAYQRPSKDGSPKPIRPGAGRAVWRDFDGLFLPPYREFRPNILNQLEIAEVQEFLPYQGPIPLRVIGLRAVGGKIYEWEESGFQLNPLLLDDVEGASHIQKGLEFAEHCEERMKKIFYDYFGGAGKDKRFKVSVSDMSRHYWQKLGPLFHLHIQAYTGEADYKLLGEQWLETVVRIGQNVFGEAAETVPTSGFAKKPALKKYEKVRTEVISKTRLQREAMNECREKLNGYRQKYGTSTV